ncbi:MAG: hypothetical protein SVX38_12745, partial [Chloroflexota bacterium]|nr:hypothetical protein [Chloroflexota bacterium]
MRRLTWSVATLAILLLACNVSGPPAATPDESALQTRVAQSVAATLTAMPSATPVPLQPTDTPSPTSLPLPPTPQPPVPDYAIEEERIIGSYVIRVWRNPASDPLTFDSILTISSAGQPQARIEFFAGLGKETGTDITGEGHPDVVVSVFSGGAHCCFSTVVYDLGPALMKVMETPLSNCDGYFQDLNGDGALEFITCDDSFVYEYCSF